MIGSQYKSNQLIDNTRTYTYDPRYRLVNATGRMHATVTDKSTNVVVPSPDDNDYAPYDIDYTYDPVGNLTKNEEYSPGSLHYKAGRVDLFNGDTTEAGSFTDPALGNFTYDANGNTLSTPRQHEMAFTFDNQPRYVDMLGGGEVRYLRHADQRVVRLVKKGNVFGLTLYLGPFELHKRIRTGGADNYTKLVLHVSGEQRLAQVEKVLAGSDSTSLSVFFVHADHLGSGHVLTKADGTLLSQEEYFPYGRASDRRDARNRYRYIGVERDEDTGLCMTGPRTYDPVSGRFLQGDPLVKPGRSPFEYSASSPVGRSNPSGYDPDAPLRSRPINGLNGEADFQKWMRDGSLTLTLGQRDTSERFSKYFVGITWSPDEFFLEYGLGFELDDLPRDGYGRRNGGNDQVDFLHFRGRMGSSGPRYGMEHAGTLLRGQFRTENSAFAGHFFGEIYSGELWFGPETTAQVAGPSIGAQLDVGSLGGNEVGDRFSIAATAGMDAAGASTYNLTDQDGDENLEYGMRVEVPVGSVEYISEKLPAMVGLGQSTQPASVGDPVQNAEAAADTHARTAAEKNRATERRRRNNANGAR